MRADWISALSRFAHTLARLGFTSYAEYLRSPHWSAFKADYKASGRPLRCAVCGGRPIQLHHHTYIRLGEESLDDVTPVCRPHHEAVHEWLKSSGRVFVEYTHEAVAALRGAQPVAPPKKPKPKKVPKRLAKWKRKKFGKQKPCIVCRKPARRGKDHCRPCARDVKLGKVRGRFVSRSVTKTPPKVNEGTRWDDPLMVIRSLANGQQLPPLRRKEPPPAP